MTATQERLPELPEPIELTTDKTYEEWRALAPTFQTRENAHRWEFGDWLVEGETRWGEKAAQAEGETGYPLDTLNAVRATALAFPQNSKSRHEYGKVLPFSFFRELRGAGFEGHRGKILKVAAAGGADGHMTRDEFRTYLRAYCEEHAIEGARGPRRVKAKEEPQDDTEGTPPPKGAEEDRSRERAEGGILVKLPAETYAQAEVCAKDNGQSVIEFLCASIRVRADAIENPAEPGDDPFEFICSGRVRVLADALGKLWNTHGDLDLFERMAEKLASIYKKELMAQAEADDGAGA